jgi:hypothetical protein
MPTVELTFDQVVHAVRELPASDRRRLLNEVFSRPETTEVRVAAKRLRKKHQADPKQRKRMSDLLAKGNAGTLTADESRELDALVADFERRTVALAEELAESFGMVVPRVESESTS